ncbi:MAG: 3-oxoadipate enol-lactonase [Ferrovibrio sp.]|nr:3-oxoadipate enol-lactonase [Ferrovibrio sp.]
MPYMELPDASLHYRLDGPDAAPVLLLSNSLGTDLSLWEPQMAALTRHLRVLRYDTRGHGGSSVSPGPYTLDQLGRDAVALLDSLGIMQAHIAGVSLGGMTALWLASHAPERVLKIAPCFTSAHIGNPEIWNQRIANVAANGMAAVVEGVLERWFTAEYRAAAPDVMARFRHMLLGMPPAGYAAASAAVRDMDLRDALSRITAPTLVIAGRGDMATPPAHGEAIAAGINGARIELVDAAHIGNVEAAVAVTPLLLEFFTT